MGDASQSLVNEYAYVCTRCNVCKFIYTNTCIYIYTPQSTIYAYSHICIFWQYIHIHLHKYMCLYIYTHKTISKHEQQFVFFSFFNVYLYVHVYILSKHQQRFAFSSFSTCAYIHMHIYTRRKLEISTTVCVFFWKHTFMFSHTFIHIYAHTQDTRDRSNSTCI